MPNFVFLLLMTLTGCVVGIQGAVNTGLKKTIGVWESGLVSLTVTVFTSSFLVIFFRSGRFLLILSVPPWQLFGGFCGVAFISLSILCVSKIGAYKSSTASALGQLSCTMLLDHFGLFNLSVKQLDFWRVIGFSFLVIGVLSVSKKLQHQGRPDDSIPKKEEATSSFLYVMLMIAAGGSLGLQGAINAGLSRTIGSMEGVLVSAIISTACLFLIVCITKSGNIRALSTAPRWQLTGGLCGFVILISNIVAVPVIGTYATSVAVSFGQLSCTILIDHFGLFNLPVSRINRYRIFGFLLMISGVIFVFHAQLFK